MDAQICREVRKANDRVQDVRFCPGRFIAVPSRAALTLLLPPVALCTKVDDTMFAGW